MYRLCFLLTYVVALASAMIARLGSTCQFGVRAEFSAPPSSLRLCLGESNTAALGLQAFEQKLGAASSFRDAGVHFVIAMVPSEILTLAMPTSDSPDVLAMVEVRMPVADSAAGARWFAQKVPATDMTWTNCPGDGLGEWSTCRRRTHSIAAGHSLVETVRLSIVFPGASGIARQVFVTHNKNLLEEFGNAVRHEYPHVRGWQVPF